MDLWGDKYTKFLEQENRDLKEQNKLLTDALLAMKGGAPVYSQKQPPAAGKSRVMLHDLARRLEAKERIS